VLDSVVFSGNFGLRGSALSVGPSGGARIVNSTFTRNDADQDGAAILGIGADAQVEITNSTITGNNADDSGGAISWLSTGTLTIDSSTIAGNVANADNTGSHSGGGISNGGAGSIQIANTLLVGNAVDTAVAIPNQCAGAFTSSGFNLRSSNDIGCTGFTGTGDLFNPNPMIGMLGPNGGPTDTIPLLTGSPAINAGNPASPGGVFPVCPGTDQRGLPRGGGAGVCDVGAFEVQPPPPEPPPTTSPSTTFDLAKAIKKCKKKFRKGPKRKKCIKRAKQRSRA
jgi:hypothetical protein